jgi:hypothetical protein
LTPRYITEVANLKNELQAIKSSKKWRLALKLSELTPAFLKSLVR